MSEFQSHLVPGLLLASLNQFQIDMKSLMNVPFSPPSLPLSLVWIHFFAVLC